MDRISIDSRPISGRLKEYLPLEITIVNKTELEPLWDHMVRKFHYLSYTNMIGPRIKYLVRYKGTPIAALSYNRASFRITARDNYIGWNPQQKKHCLKYVVNNNRFLILPWVKINNLASYLLSRTLKMLQNDWLQHFGVAPCLVETFVDLCKYKGICYRAANWLFLGETGGYAKAGDTFIYHGQKKGFTYIHLTKRDSKN